MPKSSVLSPAAPSRSGLFSRLFQRGPAKGQLAALPQRVADGVADDKRSSVQHRGDAEVPRLSKEAALPDAIAELQKLWNRNAAALYGASRDSQFPQASAFKLSLVRGNAKWAAAIPHVVAASSLPPEEQYQVLLRTTDAVEKLCSTARTKDRRLDARQCEALKSWACEMSKVMGSGQLRRIDDGAWKSVSAHLEKAGLRDQAQAFRAGQRASGVSSAYL